MMRAISLFAGGGGFEIGFDRAGIQTVLQAESDPWCLEVLARHWPDVERVTDVRNVDAAWLHQFSDDFGRRCGGSIPNRDSAVARLNGGLREPSGRDIDLVYGCWPCQDLSVAGNRAGLRGERSGLFYEFARVVRELRPRWIAAENVPGLLSSADGADFGIVLRTLVDLGYGVAWRVLDGRWFGVPQRRRRVLIVGCLGDAHRAAQVLAVCESCGGHPAPRRETGQAVAPTLVGGSDLASSHGKHNGSDRGALIAATLSGGGHPSSNLPGRHHEDDVNLIVARGQTARQERLDGDSDNFIVAQNGSDIQVSEHFGAVSASYARQTSGDLIAFDWQTQGSSRTRPHANGKYAGPLEAGKRDALAGAFGVRRLTPLECERLMGWPDDWTRWTADGREIPDSHRYRICGNGIIATVAEWLGHRLMRAHSFEPEVAA